VKKFLWFRGFMGLGRSQEDFPISPRGFILTLESP
jgi:hypothetical protein